MPANAAKFPNLFKLKKKQDLMVLQKIQVIKNQKLLECTLAVGTSKATLVEVLSIDTDLLHWIDSLITNNACFTHFSFSSKLFQIVQKNSKNTTKKNISNSKKNCRIEKIIN